MWLLWDVWQDSSFPSWSKLGEHPAVGEVRGWNYGRGPGGSRPVRWVAHSIILAQHVVMPQVQMYIHRHLICGITHCFIDQLDKTLWLCCNTRQSFCNLQHTRVRFLCHFWLFFVPPFPTLEKLMRIQILMLHPVWKLELLCWGSDGGIAFDTAKVFLQTLGRPSPPFLPLSSLCYVR